MIEAVPGKDRGHAEPGRFLVRIIGIGDHFGDILVRDGGNSFMGEGERVFEKLHDLGLGLQIIRTVVLIGIDGRLLLQ